jgi:hypothetical protein
MHIANKRVIPALTLLFGEPYEHGTLPLIMRGDCIPVLLLRVYQMFARDMYRKRNKVGGMNVEYSKDDPNWNIGPVSEGVYPP